jgi:hypothetical protein
MGPDLGFVGLVVSSSNLVDHRVLDEVTNGLVLVKLGAVSSQPSSDHFNPVATSAQPSRV